MGLTGWRKNEAVSVAKRAFREWLMNRSGTGSSDADAGIRAVRSFILTHATSRFEISKSVRYHDQQATIRDRVGFVRLDKGTGEPEEYYIFPETFRNEVCKGHSWRAVLKELDARGYLRREPPDMTMKPNLPGAGRPRVYCVRASILKGDD